jgi:hypothetical protein
MTTETRSTTETGTPTANLARLDYAIEADGIHADSVSLLLLAHSARDLGVNDTLVSVMIDEAEPEVARVRAYARVASVVGTRLASRPSAAVRQLVPAC